MANWHVDLYGVVDDEKEAQEAVDALVSTAEEFGMNAGFSTPEVTPPKPAPVKPVQTETKK